MVPVVPGVPSWPPPPPLLEAATPAATTAAPIPMAPPTVTPPATGVDRVSGSEEAGASAGASAASSDVLRVARVANISSFFTLRLLVGSFLQKEGRLRLARGQCKQKSPDTIADIESSQAFGLPESTVWLMASSGALQPSVLSIGVLVDESLKHREKNAFQVPPEGPVVDVG